MFLAQHLLNLRIRFRRSIGNLRCLKLCLKAHNFSLSIHQLSTPFCSSWCFSFRCILDFKFSRFRLENWVNINRPDRFRCYFDLRLYPPWVSRIYTFSMIVCASLCKIVTSMIWDRIAVKMLWLDRLFQRRVAVGRRTYEESDHSSYPTAESDHQLSGNQGSAYRRLILPSSKNCIAVGSKNVEPTAHPARHWCRTNLHKSSLHSIVAQPAPYPRWRPPRVTKVPLDPRRCSVSRYHTSARESSFDRFHLGTQTPTIPAETRLETAQPPARSI